MTKSGDLKPETFKEQASKPYNNKQAHICYNNCRVTSAEVILPFFSKGCLFARGCSWYWCRSGEFFSDG